MSIEDKVQSTELVKSKSWFQRARDYVGIDLLHLDNPHKCINSNPVTFYFFSDMILQEVVSQQKTSYDAGLKWSNRRFKKVAKVLAEKISEMPVQCYMAGLNWPHRNFELVADITKIDDTSSEVQLEFNGKFNAMMAMMVKRPLTSFIETLTNNLEGLS